MIKQMERAASKFCKVCDPEFGETLPMVRIAYAPDIEVLLRSFADEEAAEKAKQNAIKPKRLPYGLD